MASITTVHCSARGWTCRITRTRKSFTKPAGSFTRTRKMPDWENVPEGLIGESWISENFFTLRDAVEQLGDTEQEAFFVWCNYKSRDLSEEDADDLIKNFWDEYQGQYDDEEDFAYQIVEECYDLPEFAKSYFDYEKFARDLFMCDYWMDEGFVFRAA